MALNSTRLINVCEALLKEKGFNEFERNDGNPRIIPTFKVDYNETLMYQLIKGDDEVYNILEPRFFPYICTNSLPPDSLFNYQFKRFFTIFFFSEYWNRELRYETLDIVISKLASRILMDWALVEYLYNNYSDIITNKNESVSDTKSNGYNKVRSLFRSLPQEVATININDDEVTTADTNDLTNSSSDLSGNSVNTTTNVNIDTILAMMNVFRQIFKTWCDPLFSRVQIH